MSIRYFTNNAATGTGSLYQALIDAEEGDTITPDPEVFPAGSVIDITIANFLPLSVSCSLDAGASRIVIRRASYLIVDNRPTTGYERGFNARGVTFKGRVIFQGSEQNILACRFSQCVFSCNGKTYISLQSTGYSDIVVEDSAIIGGLNRGIYTTGEGVTLALNRCTIAANKYSSNLLNASCSDCIIDPDLSASPFRNVPTSLDAYDELNPPPCDEWDFTPVVGSGYTEGATSAASCNDLDGIERGRVLEDGSTVYALGAYECIDGAFWAGADAEGNPVAPKFNSAEGWSSFRNATKGNLDAPPERCFVINKQVSFTDSPSLTSLKIARASVALNGTGGAIQEVYLDEGGTLTNVGAGIHYLECAEGSRYSGWNYVDNARIKTSAAVTIDRSTAFNSLTIEEGATIELSDGALVGVDSPIINGGEVRANKRAYFAIHPTDDATKATFTNVVLTPRGAGIQSFYATANVDGAVKFDVELTDSSIPILIEKHNNDTQEWETLYGEFLPDQEVDINTPQAIALGLIYRACDGANFYVDMTTIPGFLWFTKCWAVNEGGGGGDPDAPTWKVSAWGVDPQLEE